MLAVSPLSAKNERESEMEAGFSVEDSVEYLDFSSGNLLESIDFDDLFVGISDGELLPELEIDSGILAEFSVGNNDSDMNTSANSFDAKKDDKASGSDLCSGSSSIIHGDEIVSTKRDDQVAANPSHHEHKGRTSSANSKNPLGKRKVKVDWTPELHRRFVQAVEQIGVDKAVPSRILELMGIDCLTRHNIASHLQKYRSHRKHLLAREAEAASWSQRRHVYGSATGKRDVNPWIAPTMGFPPVSQMPPHFRPLHVWGHPSVDQSFVHMWPKQLAPSQPHPLLHPPAPDSSYWHSHHQNLPTQGTPCFPTHFPPARFPSTRVPGTPTAPPAGQTVPKPPSDVHPSNETIDAAIEDVLSKPWLPLPLGLKPPSIDSVMSELQVQGISKIPPPCA